MLVLLIAIVTVVGATMIATDTLRAGWAFGRVVAHVDQFLNPPRDPGTGGTVAAGPRPPASVVAAASAEASPTPSVAPSALGASSGTPASAGPAPGSPSGSPSASPSASPTPTTSPTAPPTPAPAPTRAPVQVSIADNPDAVFAHELTKEWCAAAGTQIVLAILGLADTSDAFQRELAGRIGEWESRQDSRNGGWGPAAIAEALAAYGEPGYEIRAYRTRDDALLDAALAISETRKPVVLLTWRGAHTWVMTGYKADADPLVFPDAKLTHAQILDPWYPFVSSIWGASHRPGFYHTMKEMDENYLPWARPEGAYPDRDGMFIAVVPTLPR